MKGKIKENRMFTILLADDDEDERLVFTEAFKDLEIDTRIETALNGIEVLEFLGAREHLPDMLFLDLNMPKKNGIETLKELRLDPRYSELCVCIYSNSSSEQDIEDTFILGANVYIQKSGDFEFFKRLLHKAISTYGHYTEPSLKREFFLLNLSI